MTLSGVVSAFAVPSHCLGEPPKMDTRRQRGVVLRAHCQMFGLGFNDWPEEAQEAELADQRRILLAGERP